MTKDIITIYNRHIYGTADPSLSQQAAYGKLLGSLGKPLPPCGHDSLTARAIHEAAAELITEVNRLPTPDLDALPEAQEYELTKKIEDRYTVISAPNKAAAHDLSAQLCLQLLREGELTTVISDDPKQDIKKLIFTKGSLSPHDLVKGHSRAEFCEIIKIASQRLMKQHSKLHFLSEGQIDSLLSGDLMGGQVFVLNAVRSPRRGDLIRRLIDEKCDVIMVVIVRPTPVYWRKVSKG